MAGVGFLVGWTGACVLVVWLDLVFLVGRAASGGVFCVFFGVCELSMIFGRLSANGWGCVSVLLLFGMARPAPELAGHWLEPGLCIETEISGSTLGD